MFHQFNFRTLSLKKEPTAFTHTVRRSYPRQFRANKITVIGCGQVGDSLIHHLPGHYFTATFRSLEKHSEKRKHLGNHNARFLNIDLAQPKNLARLTAFSNQMIWMAPPIPNANNHQLMTRFLLKSRLRKPINAPIPKLVYISTTGVYGNLDGHWADESTPVNPGSERATRRVHVETSLKQGFKQGLASCCLVRAPGIYSINRLPLARLEKQTPALAPEEDSFSNHIHEIDLARICFLALFKSRPWDIINAVDKQPMKMGDYFDLVADHFQLKKPPRMTKETLQQQVSPMQWSFIRESRQIRSIRLEKLKIKLLYPTVTGFLNKLNANKT